MEVSGQEEEEEEAPWMELIAFQPPLTSESMRMRTGVWLFNPRCPRPRQESLLTSQRKGGEGGDDSPACFWRNGFDKWRLLFPSEFSPC